MVEEVYYRPGAKIPEVNGKKHKIRCQQCKGFFVQENGNRYLCKKCSPSNK